MVKVLIAFSCIGIYIGIMLAVYAILDKLEPYNPIKDELDLNKGLAFVWPLSIPFVVVAFAVERLCKVMELIRNYGKGSDNYEH